MHNVPVFFSKKSRAVATHRWRAGSSRNKKARERHDFRETSVLGGVKGIKWRAISLFSPAADGSSADAACGMALHGDRNRPAYGFLTQNCLTNFGRAVRLPKSAFRSRNWGTWFWSSPDGRQIKEKDMRRNVWYWGKKAGKWFWKLRVGSKLVVRRRMWREDRGAA